MDAITNPFDGPGKVSVVNSGFESERNLTINSQLKEWAPCSQYHGCHPHLICPQCADTTTKWTICLKESGNVRGKGATATKDTAKGLVASIYLAAGSKVLVTSKVTQPAGVCNGSFGIVKEIVYDEGAAGPPALYLGLNNRGGKMLPLTTAWAITVWKGQGQTFIGPVLLDLGKDEKEHGGLAYVVFSCAT
eukprot:scaffold146819_cov49-Attheya_sp.AAC.1